MSTASISYEFFPPKSELASAKLQKTAKVLAGFSPEFVSVTYGAGGTTQDGTFKAVADMKTIGLDPAAHLTCVDATKSEIDAIVDDYYEAGIRRIVALRGDSPNGIGKAYAPTPGGYAYGSDLVHGIKSRHADIDVAVSAYPEKHPEDRDWNAQIDVLKRKVDAGADRAITQYFFKAETFLTYLEKVRAAGITIPIIPGIMLQPNFEGLCNMSAKCGVDVPDDVRAIFAPIAADKTALIVETTQFALGLIEDLQAGGVNGFHLYTLNKSAIAAGLTRTLKARETSRRAA